MERSVLNDKIFLKLFLCFASDILSADRQLAKEIEFDLRKFEEEQEEMKSLHDQQNTVQSLQVAIVIISHSMVVMLKLVIKWFSALNARVSLKSEHSESC